MTQKEKNVKKKPAVKICVNLETISFLHGMYNPYNFSWPNTVPCLFLHFSRFFMEVAKENAEEMLFAVQAHFATFCIFSLFQH